MMMIIIIIIIIIYVSTVLGNREVRNYTNLPYWVLHTHTLRKVLMSNFACSFV
jgi:hypothetical protein